MLILMNTKVCSSWCNLDLRVVMMMMMMICGGGGGGGYCDCMMTVEQMEDLKDRCG